MSTLFFYKAIQTKRNSIIPTMFFHYLTFGAKQYTENNYQSKQNFYISFEKEILKNSHCIFFVISKTRVNTTNKEWGMTLADVVVGKKFFNTSSFSWIHCLSYNGKVREFFNFEFDENFFLSLPKNYDWKNQSFSPYKHCNKINLLLLHLH